MKQEFKVIADLLPKNTRVLDVGCGGGIICEPLARLGAKVTGIDFAPNNIKAAKIHSKKNKLKINYIYKDIEKSKLVEKFDIILMFEVLEHLDNWKKTIKNIKKNLNKNGILIISTINRNLFPKLFAINIAEKTKASVTGITLSENQLEFSKNKVKELNLGNQVDFKLLDYRDLNEKYDKIVSVGMFEHVGKKFYNTYSSFRSIRAVNSPFFLLYCYAFC